ncbi:Dimeric dUTPase, all-alpha-NTP-PPase (MazG) superfamily [Parageobacillus thermantarcticus]|uniref:Dimeric dUTPase, all-alpha-NTP-PPase (MazG) superfamily n=1 Tax=Parageobacillus thermantarcticus TaxID=186116 RepID=A0A1I0TJ55_9BACL|nr:dUTP diphosphatase [Parageobacillus thermantarcticus]SFA51006.1 Dimeric dUTPase, all-alpha-NTP-PPase (MazG) superfamily [Parageobacillus thermantarcticus]
MNLSKLFELQRKLDEHIEREHPRQEDEDRLAKKILALQVELGELANEWRGFKFWSSDQAPRIGIPSVHYDENLGHDVVEYVGPNPFLEEYVDCLHFILSIAIELGYTVDDLYVWDDELVGKTEDIFLELMYWVVLIKSKDERKRKDAFRTVCYIFFNMAEQRLGFTWEQIEEAYIWKNAVNHQRQESGY